MIILRIAKAGREAVKPSLSTIGFLFSVMIPVSLGVLLIEKSGILLWIARFTAPLMGFLGLPGEAALVFLSAGFIGIYSAIAVIETLNLSVRDIIILATLCLIAHNFFVECVVLKKAGSSALKMVIVRFFCGIAAAWVLNRILPVVPLAQAAALPQPGAIGLDLGELPSILLTWLAGIALLLAKIAIIIFGILFMQKLLDEFGLIKILGKLSAPFMRILGLSPNAGYVWIIGNVIGLVYGSAVLIEETRSGILSSVEADLFNHHVAISHSQVEDSLLFAALGVPLLWVALPRLVVAVILVWFERLRRLMFRRSFSVKVETG